MEPKVRSVLVGVGRNLATLFSKGLRGSTIDEAWPHTERIAKNLTLRGAYD
jgi:hypothetical protein